MLSGFLLPGPTSRARGGRPPHPATGRYYWKRLLRIYPVYVVTVVLALALHPGERRRSASRDWLRTLMLTDIYVEPARCRRA